MKYEETCISHQIKKAKIYGENSKRSEKNEEFTATTDRYEAHIVNKMEKSDEWLQKKNNWMITDKSVHNHTHTAAAAAASMRCERRTTNNVLKCPKRQRKLCYVWLNLWRLIQIRRLGFLLRKKLLIEIVLMPFRWDCVQYP